MLLVSRIFVRFRRQQAQNFRNCVNFSNLKKKILVCLFPTKKMRKSKKIRFWRVRNRQTAQFSWETDKLKIFLKNLKFRAFPLAISKDLSKKAFLTILEPRETRGGCWNFIKSLKIFHFQRKRLLNPNIEQYLTTTMVLFFSGEGIRKSSCGKSPNFTRLYLRKDKPLLW